MSTADKKSNYREDFPGYQGFIPYKYSIIGKNIGATNATIKALLTDEPPTEASIKPGQSQDYSHYNRDYYCDNFDRSFPLEEEKVFSNKSKDAKTWISGNKYKIYPQHIPKSEVHVPGIYSANLYGKGFSKTTAIAVKNEYNKGLDCSSAERYETTNQRVYSKPKTRSKEDDLNIADKAESTFFVGGGNRRANVGNSVDNLYRVYHSKIAKIPTVGYTGNQSIFQNQIGYLNYDKILQKEKEIKAGPGRASYADLPPKFQNALKIVLPDEEPPFVPGYRGYKAGVKARGLYGANISRLTLQARNEDRLKTAI